MNQYIFDDYGTLENEVNSSFASNVWESMTFLGQYCETGDLFKLPVKKISDSVLIHNIDKNSYFSYNYKDATNEIPREDLLKRWIEELKDLPKSILNLNNIIDFKLELFDIGFNNNSNDEKISQIKEMMLLVSEKSKLSEYDVNDLSFLAELNYDLSTFVKNPLYNLKKSKEFYDATKILNRNFLNEYNLRIYINVCIDLFTETEKLPYLKEGIVLLKNLVRESNEAFDYENLANLYDMYSKYQYDNGLKIKFLQNAVKYYKKSNSLEPLEFKKKVILSLEKEIRIHKQILGRKNKIYSTKLKYHYNPPQLQNSFYNRRISPKK